MEGDGFEHWGSFSSTCGTEVKQLGDQEYLLECGAGQPQRVLQEAL